MRDLISHSLNGVWDEATTNANQARMIMRCAELTQHLTIPTVLINLELAAAYMIELINVRQPHMSSISKSLSF